LTRSRSQSSVSSHGTWPEDFDEQLRIIREQLPGFSSDELAELAADSALVEQFTHARPPQEGTAQSAPVVIDDESEEFEEMFTEAELLEIEAVLDLYPAGDSPVETPALGDSGTVRARLRGGADSDVPMSDLEFATSSDPGTQVDSGRQSSTKMRVATLAILKRWTGDLELFKSMFTWLRNYDELVLHLCGCGIKFTNSDGVSCSGCVEPTHLMLGSSELNRTHLIFHKAMQACDVDDYLTQVRIAHRAQPGCQEIF
jgi:hypothetical protein